MPDRAYLMMHCLALPARLGSSAPQVSLVPPCPVRVPVTNPPPSRLVYPSPPRANLIGFSHHHAPVLLPRIESGRHVKSGRRLSSFLPLVFPRLSGFRCAFLSSHFLILFFSHFLQFALSTFIPYYTEYLITSNLARERVCEFR